MNNLVITKTDVSIMDTVPAPLSADERALLADCERLVDDGLNALWIIREQKLYREQHATFHDYMAARWSEESRRRRNQRLAGLRVFALLREALGEGAPIPGTEYTLRPLVGLVQIDPERAVAVYLQAVAAAGTGVPSHSDILAARQQVLTERELHEENARRQLEITPYEGLKAEAGAGASAVRLLALADALTACEPVVREQMIRYGIRDTALMRRMNQLWRDGRDTAEEIFTTGYLQFPDGQAVKFQQASLRDLQALLDLKWKEHLSRARDERRGQAVSLVVYDGDARSTLEALQAVLSYTTLVQLQDLISQEL